MSESTNIETITVHVDAELEEVVPVFLKCRIRELSQMRQAQAQGDYGVIMKLAHNAKGSGGAYGFDTISTLGELLENAARRRDNEGIEKYLEEMEDYLSRVQISFG